MRLYETEHGGREASLLLSDEDAKERGLDPEDGQEWPPAPTKAEPEATPEAPADGEPPADGEDASKAAPAPANKSRTAANK